MKVEEVKDKFPKWEEASSHMSLEEFQLLHQFIGSKWDEEYNVRELIRGVSVLVPNPKALSKFFGIYDSHVRGILRGIPDKKGKEIKVPIERISEIEHRLDYMTKRFEETLLQMLKKTEDVESLDARTVLGIDVIENRLEQMAEKLEETLLQVRTKGIKPTHEKALANHYVECDLQDMIILLEEAEKEDKDSFYNHWDMLLKTSSTGELIDALFEVLQTESKHAVARFDEVFAALKNRAPFEQIHAQFVDIVGVVKEGIKESSKLMGEVYPEDYMAFKEYVWEMFKATHAIVTTFDPRMTKLMEKAREDAKTISGYAP